jgi:hypothetical protein
MVYVDRLVSTRGRWLYHNSCHMTADTVEELVEFAADLGLRVEWLQVSRSGTPHFDITPTKRKAAVKLGAKEI